MGARPYACSGFVQDTDQTDNSNQHSIVFMEREVLAKAHRKKKSGKKVDNRKKGQKDAKLNQDAAAAAKRNPRAFIFSSKGKAKIQKARTAEREQRRMHVPVVEQLTDEPAPYVVLVHGPPGVGKSTLIRCLVKHYTKQDVKDIKGPVTVVAGKQRRLMFVEAPQDMTAMIDAAKYADLVLLLIDGDFGFEMETFEFLNLMQVHGFPKVMGVLTHLDTFTDTKALKKTKKTLKHRFWSEIYQGAKLFYLSGIKNGRYLNREVLNLARFISVMKFRPLSWRQSHPYFVVDRFEDTTSREAIRKNPKCDRDIAVYGYVRGTNWKGNVTAHIAGAGDYRPTEVMAMPDPCPLPSQLKKRGLNEKERLIYAPMSDVGGLLYDKDAMYIDIPDWKVQYSATTVTNKDVAGAQGEALVRDLQATRMTVDEKLGNSKIQLFSRGPDLLGSGDTFAEDRAASSSDDGSDDDDGDDDDGDDDEDSSDGGEEEGGEAHGVTQELVEHNGRTRRRAVFREHQATGYDDKILGRAGDDSDADNSDDESDRERDEEGLGMAARWKSKFGSNVSALFASRSADLQSYIYGNPDASLRRPSDDDALGLGGRRRGVGNANVDVDSDEEDLFYLKRSDGGSASKRPVRENNADDDAEDDKENIDADDCSRQSQATGITSIVDKWSEPDMVEGLRDRFVTGDWEAGAARNAMRPDDDEANSDGEVYGDFEDLETGQVFEGSDDMVTQAAAKALKDVQREELAAKKAAKKAAFNQAYDQGGTKAIDEKIGGHPETAEDDPDGSDADEDEEIDTYYDEIKKGMVDRAKRTKDAMDALDPAQRIAMEGHRPGAYVRMRFSGIPYELVEFFDPRHPILIGGLGKSEEAQGYMQLRLKRHRWYPKILKNKDPLIFSIGWRRFQSMPLFAIKDNNERHRMLKYSPEHMHCFAAIWGPLAPPGTGVIAIQKLSSSIQHWRVSATGVILQLDAALNIVKKLKLVGTPFKIHRHQAFISGMFNSQLEAAKFEGASIRTVSGIRGTIKKSLRVGSMAGARDGSYRATFEDKPLLSDIVFLRAWIGVDIPKFCNPVTDLLGPRMLEAQREDKVRKRKKDSDALVDGVEGAAGTGPDGLVSARGIDESEIAYEPCHKFLGPKKGFIFKKGSKGLGYYEDVGLKVLGATLGMDGTGPSRRVASGGAAGAAGAAAAVKESGWVPMKTVADIRREKNIGAPRLNDSLYRDIERKPKVFNPLRVPKSLQAELPFKSKPKIQSARKRKTLEQKRAVVVEGVEKKKRSLVAQLNAIRNVKAEARREQRKKYQEKVAKKQAAEMEWRSALSKEARKRKFVLEGQAEKKRARKFG